MFLHDLDYDKFDISHGDTLTDPHHWNDEPFEVIVSNLPYSVKWAGDGDAIENIEKILNIHKDKEEIQYILRLVPNDEIAKEDYNLSVSTYVEIEDTGEKDGY